jgi:hypothetical protein
MGKFSVCSPHYSELADDNESLCCNFKTPAEKEAERNMEPQDVVHFASMRSVKKFQFLLGILLLVYGLLLVFSPEYMAFKLFIGKEYMQDQGFVTTVEDEKEETLVRHIVDELNVQKEAVEEEAQASDTLAMTILKNLLGPDVNPTTKQVIVANQAAREAEFQLKQLEKQHDEKHKAARAQGAASIPFQQFCRLYGSIVIAVALHALTTVTINYEANCSVAQMYIFFYGAQSIALLMAVMPIVKVDNTITTIISSSWDLKLLLLLFACCCAFWVWMYQRLRVAAPHVSSIMGILNNDVEK